MAWDPHAEWLAAKKSFETITGTKKPKETAGIVAAFTNHTGLSGSLKEVKAAYDKVFLISDLEVKDGLKAMKEFKSAEKSFNGAKKTYLTILDKEIKDVIRNKPDPNIKSTYEKALKFLRKELDALESTTAAQIASFEQKFDVASKNLSQAQKQLNNWSVNVNAACKRGIAAAAKIKADPTPATWNASFPTAARDITMQLVHARKLSDLAADPDTLAAPLLGYANQGGGLPATVPLTHTAKEILPLLKTYINAVKKVVELAARRG